MTTDTANSQPETAPALTAAEIAGLEAIAKGRDLGNLLWFSLWEKHLVVRDDNRMTLSPAGIRALAASQQAAVRPETITAKEFVEQGYVEKVKRGECQVFRYDFERDAEIIDIDYSPLDRDVLIGVMVTEDAMWDTIIDNDHKLTVVWLPATEQPAPEDFDYAGDRRLGEEYDESVAMEIASVEMCKISEQLNPILPSDEMPLEVLIQDGWEIVLNEGDFYGDDWNKVHAAIDAWGKYQNANRDDATINAYNKMLDRFINASKEKRSLEADNAALRLQVAQLTGQLAAAEAEKGRVVTLNARLAKQIMKLKHTANLDEGFINFLTTKEDDHE